MKLPHDYRRYIDKYFLRSKEILKKDNLNPEVIMQVFIRDGPGVLRGIDEAVRIIKDHAPDAKVYSLSEEDRYESNETIMLIKARLQDIIDIETLYLGIITSATTNKEIDIETIHENAKAIRKLLPDRILSYFGARHWHYSKDAEISKAIIDSGFDSCSTDEGAIASGLSKGVGTIPHALVIAYAEKYGMKDATTIAAKAFDRHIDIKVPRIALIDTFNMEIDDSLRCAKEIPYLWGVRIDTAGELIGQGGIEFDGRKYWTGKGVTVESVYAVRKALDDAGFSHIKIMLSSGFGNIKKIKAFIEGEKKYGRLFDGLGIGGLFDAKYATADIVKINGKEFSKTGRKYRSNDRLKKKY